MGIQTLDGAAMRACGRRGSPDAVLDGLRRLRRVAGVAIHADLLAGLPGVTWERLVQDLGTLTAEGVDEIQLELLKLLPGTRLEAMAERLGLVAAPRPPYDLLRTPACSAADLWRAARLGRVVDGFYNAPPLRSLVRTASGRSAAFWPDLEAAVTAEGGIRGQWSLRKRFFLLKRFLTTRWPDLVPALVDAWYRRDDGIAPEVAPARLWRGPLPAEARFLEGSAGDWSRVVAVGEPPYRFYAFRVEPDGRHRLAAVAERT
ncbi:MAG: coproporphyrinogen III oxidase [candidate division TA06 bacterium ADurb.Bin417]|uniref:Coproporphyrinogen III oxidase n=1 Tax=candidate division TA06 bacterium ADurb.Bin417 TaxID=1852828 RepID=A0A1V5M6G2_UNCT6|nr:MAG: coproporphyrinogen III oxidase [candidate division TA06 bacterium ADurb.Bin417]